jgi:choline-glycine betaine transporter
MVIFGGLAVTTELGDPQSLNQILENKGPEHVLYAVLDALPFASVLALIIIIISFLSYVTAADSNLDVISNLTLKQSADGSTPTPSSRKFSLGFKLIWAVAVGFAAWIMTALSGIDGVKMLSNLGGLPALFIILTFNVVLIVLGTVKLKSLRM